MPIILAQATPPAAVAPAPTPRPSVITQPDWLSLPSGDDMAKFYPKAAADARIEGRAVLRCTVTAAGDLADCTAPGEEPVGSGFGEAVLNLAPLFKMKPMTKDGVPVSGGKVAIPIRFVLPAPAAPASFALTTSGPKAVKWMGKPNAQELEMTMARYAKAWDGRVVMSCIAGADGRLGGCRIESESPAGVGFGATALAVAYLFRIAPTTADGASVAGGTITIPIHFYRAS